MSGRAIRMRIMDPATAHALTEVLGPFLGILALGIVPVGIISAIKFFRLKEKELELEAGLHSREAQARIAALETRQAAMESALSSLVQVLAPSSGATPTQPGLPENPARPALTALKRDP